jgi:hypothetical protein
MKTEDILRIIKDLIEDKLESNNKCEEKWRVSDYARECNNEISYWRSKHCDEVGLNGVERLSFMFTPTQTLLKQEPYATFIKKISYET